LEVPVAFEAYRASSCNHVAFNRDFIPLFRMSYTLDRDVVLLTSDLGDSNGEVDTTGRFGESNIPGFASVCERPFMNIFGDHRICGPWSAAKGRTFSPGGKGAKRIYLIFVRIVYAR
jgi:hypothetical protein